MSDKKIDVNVNIFNVPVFSGGRLRALEKVGEKLTEGGSEGAYTVLTPTTEQVVMANHDDLLCASFQKSDLNVPDSMGLVWASRGSLQERVPGVDMAESLVALAAERGLKVFLLGGLGRTAGEAAVELRIKYPVLRIKGVEGYRDIQSVIRNTDPVIRTYAETEKVIKLINDFGTDLLLVAFGAPFQERWVIEHKNKLKVKVVMVVGGALDMWAKNVPRAPVWVRKIGGEWLWRLMLQPWRFRRQLRLVEFVGMVMRSSR